MRAVRPSLKAQVWYRGRLLAIVGLLRKAGDDIAAGLRPYWPAVHDERAPGLGALLEAAAARFGNIGAVADRLAALAVRVNLGEVDDRLKASIKASIGVDIGPVLTDHGPISAAMRDATKANAELITSIPAQYLDRVRDAVSEAFASGKRWESIVEEIRHVGDVTESRAKLIARDQTSKLNSDFNRVRQTGLGIERYTWSGALDLRERPSHRAMEGSVQRWDAAPDVDGERVHPGQAIQCRCIAAPLIDLDGAGSPLLSLGGGQEAEAA